MTHNLEVTGSSPVWSTKENRKAVLFIFSSPIPITFYLNGLRELCKNNSHGGDGKMRQKRQTTKRQKPFSAFRILGVSFIILYIYYNIYII